MPFMKNIQKMDTKIWAFSRFTTVTTHFYRMVFAGSEKGHCFRQKMRFNASIVF